MKANDIELRKKKQKQRQKANTEKFLICLGFLVFTRKYLIFLL